MRIAGYMVGERWWNRAALAGLAGGVVMAVYEMIASVASGHGLWWPLNMIGGAMSYFRPLAPGVSDPNAGLPTASGSLMLPDPGMFWPGTTVGAALHLMASMVFGLGYGLLVAVLAASLVRGLARSWSFAVLAGLGWGVITWVAMGLLIGPALAPSLNYAQPGQTFIAHLIFGVVTALGFTAMTRQAHVTITFAPSEVRAEEPAARR